MGILSEKFYQQLVVTSPLEWMAVCLALAYLLLAIKESIWCWPAAFFSTAIYVHLFFNVNLYMESFLNFYYLVMAIYGWKQWKNTSKLSSLTECKKIVSWKAERHLVLIAIASLVVLVSSWLLERYSDQDFPLTDSFTTWFAILATYMVTQKVIENWLYWIAIDLVSIYLYLSKGFALTSVLFLCYVILAFVGWFSWKKRMITQIRQTYSDKRAKKT